MWPGGLLRSSTLVVLWAVVTSTLLIIWLFSLLTKEMSRLIEVQRIDALRQIVTLARYTIEPVIKDVKAKKITPKAGGMEARTILHRMLYQDESGANYVFMVGYDGTALAFPYQPEQELKSIMDLQDSSGIYITPLLLNIATNQPNGGVARYFYPMPGKTNIGEKMTFVMGIPELECFIATGMYVKNYQMQQAALLGKARFWSLILILLAVVPVGGSLLHAVVKNRQLQHEIIERQNAEAAARFNERRLQVLFNAAIDVAIVVSDGPPGKTIIRDFSPGAERLFGYRKEEIIDQPEAILFHEQDAQKLASLDAALTGDAAASRIDAKIRAKDGKELYSQLSSCWTPQLPGHEKAIMRVFVDVTERKLAEQALKQSETWWRTALDNLPFEVWTLDATGRYEIQNRLAMDRVGNRIGKSYQDTCLPENQEAHWEENHRQALSGETIRRETTCEYKGETRHVFEILTPIQEDATIRGVLGVSMDITEQRRAEAERTRLEDRLRQSQKLEAIGTLAGGIAHDFNNLLAAILSGAELAKYSVFNQPETTENLNRVLAAANRARELVRQILAFNRQTRVERTVISIQPVLEEGLKFLRATLPATIDIVTHIPDTAPPILGDPTQIHQILMNLCTNAAQAMHGNPGRLEVSLDTIFTDNSLLKQLPEMEAGRYVKLTIQDTGCGMSDTTKKRLFEPFFTTKKPGEGSGLGLSVVHGIVKSHKGFIAVKSETGVGTRFDIYFPAEKTPPPVSHGLANHTIQGGGQHILLVDDENAVLTLVEKVLKRLGYRVTANAKPLEALEQFRAAPQSFDLLLTDLTMPGMTGIELVKAVLSVRPELPIILSSGFTGAGTGARDSVSLECHYEVVNKPATMQELSVAVNKALTRSTSIETKNRLTAPV